MQTASGFEEVEDAARLVPSRGVGHRSVRRKAKMIELRNSRQTNGRSLHRWRITQHKDGAPIRSF